ncbi:uncharacterized protein [Heptranchias perlo]|uniref:uncharacterized protein n=1 Tax=Heptranchias perlo TaxID=212740 RepID=UPI0035599DAC
MMLSALFVGLFLLFQYATGSTYLFSRGPGDFTTLQCNVPAGAGNKVTWWSTSDLGTEMGKTKCKKKGMKIESCGNNNPQKSKKQNQPECKKHKTNEDRMESQSLTFDVKTSNSMVFTCTAQDSTGNGSSDCLSLVTLTGDGCENHNLFFVIIQSDSDEIFPTKENSMLMTVSEGESVTLPCQFENRKSLPFTLFWITSGNISKCLHSVHIEDYNSHSNTHCCVDRKSEQRISNQNSHNPTDRSQSHNLTIHSAHRVDIGRYLCVVHVQDSGKPVWKIAANVSLAVTGPSAESSDTSTSTSGISSVNSSITPANTENPYTGATDKFVYVVCAVVLICIVGVICIIRRNRQSVKGLSAPGPRGGDVQLMQEAECFPPAVVPIRDQRDDSELVAYAVTRVQTPTGQTRPGEGSESTGRNSVSTEHVYCVIKEPMVKGDGGETEIQGVKCRDHTDHGHQIETSSAIELKPDGQSQPKEDSKEEPVASSNEHTYSLIGCPGSVIPGDRVTESHPVEEDQKPYPLKMEENPIYAQTVDP